jgi:hypothetical protein
MEKSSTNGVGYTDATLLAAAVLRAAGMSTEVACAEAIKLQQCLAQDGWMVGKGVADVPFSWRAGEGEGGDDERPF